MGVCRLKILLTAMGHSDTADEIIIKEYASDATIRNVRDDVFHLLSDCNISVWDCTLHPPRDISMWIFQEFPEYTGPKSKTLFDAGCFPSAIWQVLPRGTQPSTRSVMEDTQYNQNDANALLTLPQQVTLVNEPSGLKPSQVLHNVTTRFDDDIDNTEAATLARRTLFLERRAKEAARMKKLENRIQKLGNIKNGTSEQVRKMLMKSRCTGAHNLKLQDRLHLHVIVIDGDAIAEHFRYFSRQDTVARVVHSFAPKLPQEAELLVTTMDQTYRRLPIMLRLYEVVEKGYLRDADSVVIRCFNPPGEEPTTSILDRDHADVEPTAIVMTDTAHDNVKMSGILDEASPRKPTAPTFFTDQLNAAIAELDKNSKTKKSSSAVKVRQMTMKSKAKGDAKRISRMEDRFFVELVSVTTGSASSSFVYVSRKDTVDRLMNEHGYAGFKAFAMKDPDFYVPISLALCLEYLEAENILRCFDRLVVSDIGDDEGTDR